MPSVPKSGLKQINKDTLWDKAYFSLKSALLAGKFAPGERIILRKVAQDLGISLTPVRDAINRLAAENVLERGGVGQGGGASVPLLNAHEFDQLMSIRSSLEPLAAEAAANNATKTEISEISKLLDQMRDLANTGNLASYLDAHYKFHFGIYKLADQSILLQAIEGAWLRCGPTLNLALPAYKPGQKRHKYHLAALNALKKGDGIGVARAIRADIDSARSDICNLLE
ncbi:MULTISPECIES: GntR family transcriptional regulator [unclassified Polynucleobacter]|jgi:DNA-binding GntR family transcriptional regulator|uniref:GntR family transcriptional regulator n=1 Tax=unclassified Polynucleobacter TaxID=2640945 RepID=UPI0023773849|nr:MULTISPECIES: GntR family transcriptional regulator [unclassified Polynucleobacter]MCX7236928.1 GntR family transcriptional regulator [Polynucleobacter sp.]BDT75842.1 DNA-binding protein [Polynucleobacter sp. KF022]